MVTHDDGHLTWPHDFVNQILCGDALAVLRQMPDSCVDCVVTSLPYWGLRAYPGTERWWAEDPACRHRDAGDGFCRCGAWFGQLGLEPGWDLHIVHLTGIFRELKRVLAPHGSLWLNLGDTFCRSWGTTMRAVATSGVATGRD